jgi:hypothetical protein
LGSRGVVLVGNSGCFPRCCRRCCRTTPTGWSRATVGGRLKKSGADSGALGVIQLASTSTLGWPLLSTRPWWTHEETRVSWEERLEVTRLDEDQDEGTQRGEQCEGEGGFAGGGRVGRRRGGGLGLLDQQDLPIRKLMKDCESSPDEVDLLEVLPKDFGLSFSVWVAVFTLALELELDTLVELARSLTRRLSRARIRRSRSSTVCCKKTTCRLRSWFSSTVFRTALSEMSRTGSVKSSMVSWFKPAAAAADNFSIASAAETSCSDSARTRLA